MTLGMVHDTIKAQGMSRDEACAYIRGERAIVPEKSWEPISE